MLRPYHPLIIGALAASYATASPAWAQSPSAAQPPGSSKPEAHAPAEEAAEAEPPPVSEPKGHNAPAPTSAPVAPVLKSFVEADYPPEQRAQAHEADVVLELDIDAEGKVVATRVMTSAGAAFDAAAQQAASQFHFEPAQREGKAVPSRIRYRYRFELAKEAAPRATSAPTGEISGRLRFASDTALSGAEVRIIDATGLARVVKSGVGGRFSFPDLPPGAYRVRIDAEGFKTFVSRERVDASVATQVRYRLQVADALNEIIVRGQRDSSLPAREVTRRTLSRREISRVPGTGGDALRSVQSMPGVARPPSIAGLLIVRGSAPQDTGVFIDQTSVPLIYHFGGLSSVVPTEMIDRIDFYPGNFGVRYGRLHGGIVDVALRSPDTACLESGKPTGKHDCFHVMGQLDLIDARVMASGPLGGDWSFALAARRSWVDAWLGAAASSGGLSVTAAPVYYDYQAIAEYRPSDKHRLSLRLFGSDDRTELIFDEPPEPGLGGGLDLGTRFIRGQALLESELATDVKLTAMLAGGWESTAFSAGNNLSFEFDKFPLEARSEVGWTIADWAKWNIGIDYLVVPVKGKVRAPSPLRPGEQAPGTLVTAPALESNPETTVHQPAGYTEVELTFFDRWQLVPGVRIDHTRSATEIAVSPRVHSRYELFGPGISDTSGPWQARTTIKGGVGVFEQPPQLQETDSVFGTPGIDSQRAIHYSLGIEQELSQQLEVSAEGFYKDMGKLVSRAPDDAGGFRYDNEGRGHGYGAELMVKYKPDELFFGWLAYSLSRSVRQDRPGGAERLFQYDQTHNLTALGSFRLPWGLEAGARFRVISGSPYTPVRSDPAAVLATDGSQYVPLSGAAFSERLPIFHQLDLRVDKKWQFESWKLSAYLDVQNVYNHRARESVGYNYNFTQEQFTEGLPTLPSLGLRGEF